MKRSGKQFNKRHIRGGFTLVEMTIAIGLTITMIGAILFFHRQLTQSRAVMLDAVDQANAHTTVMRELTRHSQAVVNDSYLGLGIEGNINSITILHTRVPDASIWDDSTLTQTTTEVQTDLQLTTYRLAYQEDEITGEFRVAGIEKVVQRQHTANRVEEEDGPFFDPDEDNTIISLLSDDFKFLAFRYWDGENWLNDWYENEPPVAIEVLLGEQPLTEDMDLDEYLETYDFESRLIHVRSREQNLAPLIQGLPSGGAGL